MRRLPTSVKRSVELLNEVSLQRWGPEQAPSYSWTYKRHYRQPSVFYIHRIRQDISPFLPADELFARGGRGHVLAKLHSAIRFATSSND